MSDKPFDAEAWDIGEQAYVTNGLTDATNGLSEIKNAPCNRPLNVVDWVLIVRGININTKVSSTVILVFLLNKEN
jgi:hypothetical protein